MARTKGHTGSQHSVQWRAHPSHASNKQNKADSHRQARAERRGMVFDESMSAETFARHKDTYTSSGQHILFWQDCTPYKRKHDSDNMHNRAPGGGLFPCCEPRWTVTLDCGHEACRHCRICTTCVK